MKNHILSYLNRNYFISISDIGNDGIYSLDDNRPVIDRPPIDQEKLLNEIHTITGIPHTEIKDLVNEWAFSIKKDVNLTFYWLSYRDLIKH
jgi:hypothetical protein